MTEKMNDTIDMIGPPPTLPWDQTGIYETAPPPTLPEALIDTLPATGSTTTLAILAILLIVTGIVLGLVASRRVSMMALKRGLERGHIDREALAQEITDTLDLPGPVRWIEIDETLYVGVPGFPLINMESDAESRWRPTVEAAAKRIIRGGSDR
jgi:hypothetical protein